MRLEKHTKHTNTTTITTIAADQCGLLQMFDCWNEMASFYYTAAYTHHTNPRTKNSAC